VLMREIKVIPWRFPVEMSGVNTQLHPRAAEKVRPERNQEYDTGLIGYSAGCIRLPFCFSACAVVLHADTSSVRRCYSFPQPWSFPTSLANRSTTLHIARTSCYLPASPLCSFLVTTNCRLGCGELALRSCITIAIAGNRSLVRSA